MAAAATAGTVAAAVAGAAKAALTTVAAAVLTAAGPALEQQQPSQKPHPNEAPLASGVPCGGDDRCAGGGGSALKR